MIEANSKAIDALMVLAKDNALLIEGLEGIRETLKFLIPSDNSKVIDCDKSIKNKIGDLRIVLTKSGDDVVKKAEAVFTDIKLVVADRKTLL